MSFADQPTNDDTQREAWRKAFEDAAETPPPRVWEAVARHLDEDRQAVIIPLWTRVRPWAMGMAASTVLILIGWWAWPVATSVGPAPAGRRMAQSETKKTEQTQAATDKGAWRNANLASVIPTPQLETVAGTIHSSSTTLPGSMAGPDRAPSDRFQRLQAKKRPLSTSQMARSTFADEIATTRLEQGVAETSERLSFGLTELAPRPFRSHLYSTQRVVWFRLPDTVEADELKQHKPAHHGAWASVSVMPSAFSPDVALRSMPVAMISRAAAYNYQNTVSTPATVSSRASVAMAYQAGAGMQINERWSVETGVGYLKGHSTVDSPTRQLAQVSSLTGKTTASNLYADAVRQPNNTANALASADVQYLISNASANAYNADIRANVENDYQYVQVPVQVGYQLRPRRKIGIALLGGLLANWFVRNNVDTDIVVKANDGLYRPLTVAGTAGARLRYASSPRWSASLAGVYQQSLQSGTHADAALETHPQTVGMSFSVDYHF